MAIFSETAEKVKLPDFTWPGWPILETEPVRSLLVTATRDSDMLLFRVQLRQPDSARLLRGREGPLHKLDHHPLTNQISGTSTVWSVLRSRFSPYNR